ncbi:hypothetical protein [Streptomyces sp. NPDC086766]|uniref:hypothetical protein n=1 Tax=Streptomyces sp. NPDC086766 TaxID=3365754 RepID=UPI003819F14A
MIELLRLIAHVDPKCREEGADRAADWAAGLPRSEATTLATVLAASAACEEDLGALEAQLHAILEISSTGQVNVENLQYLQQIDRTAVTEEIRQYVADLLEE